MIFINRLGKVIFHNDTNLHHRLNGPAEIYGNRQEWWLNGKCHRLDGPAIIHDERKSWYVNGEPHRMDGPAVIHGNYQAWWENGKRHRLDGPAIIFHNGDKSWYINNKKYTESEYQEKIKEMGLV